MDMFASDIHLDYSKLNINWALLLFQVLLYDIRSDKPLLVKDHYYGLPIKSVNFLDTQNLVLSCDTRILKLWDRDTVSLGFIYEILAN